MCKVVARFLRLFAIIGVDDRQCAQGALRAIRSPQGGRNANTGNY